MDYEQDRERMHTPYWASRDRRAGCLAAFAFSILAWLALALLVAALRS